MNFFRLIFFSLFVGVLFIYEPLYADNKLKIIQPSPDLPRGCFLFGCYNLETGAMLLGMRGKNGARGGGHYVLQQRLTDYAPIPEAGNGVVVGFGCYREGNTIYLHVIHSLKAAGEYGDFNGNYKCSVNPQLPILNQDWAALMPEEYMRSVFGALADRTGLLLEVDKRYFTSPLFRWDLQKHGFHELDDWELKELAEYYTNTKYANTIQALELAVLDVNREQTKKKLEALQKNWGIFGGIGYGSFAPDNFDPLAEGGEAIFRSKGEDASLSRRKGSPCVPPSNLAKDSSSAAPRSTAIARSAYTLFGPNFINFMTTYALSLAGVSPEVAEGAGLVAELGFEVQEIGLLQPVLPFIPVAVAAIKSKLLALATATGSGIATLASTSSSIFSSLAKLGFYSARSAAMSATNAAVHAGRTALASAGTAVGGTALAVAGTAGVVVTGGMIGYTEYLWYQIYSAGGPKDMYLIDLGKSWQRQCEKGHLFPQLGGDRHLCAKAVHKRLEEESKRYDRDLLAGNECPWYAVWCRG